MYHNNTTLTLPKKNSSIHHITAHVDRLALSALYDEVSLELKPGLVCPSSQGSHIDMDYALFLKSIDSMQGYYAQLCQLGYQQNTFKHLQQAGIQCEQRMMQATHHINTHKGAIFNLGFASAGLGQCLSKDLPLTTEYICKQIVKCWQLDLFNNLARNPMSHGQQMRKKFGISGAIEQVANGFQIIQHHALPCFQSVIEKTACPTRASIQTLLLLISLLPDTNIVWRGGMSSLLIVQEMASSFLKDGGIYQQKWKDQLSKINQYFTQHRLSPGGSADLLGVTLFFYKVENELCYHL